MKIKRFLIAGMAALAAASALQAAETADEVKANLLKSTGIEASDVVATPVPGIWAVYARQQLFYVDSTGRYVLTGSMLDVKAEQDLTEGLRKGYAKREWSTLPFGDAVKEVFGKGEREVVVFSDANCTFCRTMERVYEQTGNLTVYTFIVPMLRGEENAREIVCSKDPAKAWRSWMVNGIRPADAPASCDSSVLQRNLKLAGANGVTGTPSFFFKSGTRTTGMLSPAQFEQLLTED
ncbi:MAG: Thiol:disulfide interchange protein [Burkholderia sp.]|jgi:thiol:disulfide interchange protein DsbC